MNNLGPLVFALILLLIARGTGAQEQLRNNDVPPPSINETKIQALNIRKISSDHLTLYTDLPASAAVDELPKIFDAAVPFWCAYFRVPESSMSRWKITGSLMQDRDRFTQAGLLPKDLPPFPNGFQWGSRIWWVEQPSDYYRRHLMLHEGTHAFMFTKLRGAGPPWYTEGTAELLGTHRWQNNQLTLNYFPHDKTEVPEWGRIKIVRDDVRAGKPKTLAEILNYDSRAHQQVNAYGWCWAASAFLDGHPRYQPKFREFQKFVRDNSASFSERFMESMKEDASRMAHEWQLFISQLDYGYDVAREAVDAKTTRPFTRGETRVSIAANRGWQSTGLRLEPGKQYRLTATGRYQLGDQPKAWWCEPNGVTIEYYRGQPLGIVLAAVVDETNADQATNGFLSPTVVGSGAVVSTAFAGTLYLRVNDSPTKVGDNRGEVAVNVEAGS